MRPSSILTNKLYDSLGKYFQLVPKDELIKVKKEVLNELGKDDCDSIKCLSKIQNKLQICLGIRTNRYHHPVRFKSCKRLMVSEYKRIESINLNIIQRSTINANHFIEIERLLGSS